jgi:hypothetical protein
LERVPPDGEPALWFLAANEQWERLTASGSVAVPVLARCLREWDTNARLAAAGALGAMESHLALAVLRERTQVIGGESNRRIRSEIHGTIRRLEAALLQTDGLPVPAEPGGGCAAGLPIPHRRAELACERSSTRGCGSDRQE